MHHQRSQVRVGLRWIRSGGEGLGVHHNHVSSGIVMRCALLPTLALYFRESILFSTYVTPPSPAAPQWRVFWRRATVSSFAGGLIPCEPLPSLVSPSWPVIAGRSESVLRLLFVLVQCSFTISRSSDVTPPVFTSGPTRMSGIASRSVCWLHWDQ